MKRCAKRTAAKIASRKKTPNPVRLSARIGKSEKPVLHPRGDPPVGAVVPLLAPSADDVVTGVDRIEQARNFLGGILQVGVERHYDIAAALAKPGQQGRMLSEIAGELDDAHARVGRGKLTEHRKRIVGRAVVDEDHLEFAITSVDKGNEPPP